MRSRSAVVLLCLLATGPARAALQESCRLPAPPLSRAQNLFSPEQEAALGDLALERFGPALQPIEDDALTAGLRRIGERLAAHAPAGAPRFAFHLADQPDVNAFVLPGGRIFVSRRLVGFARSEDELAGVLAHEMGHIFGRQQTIDLSKQLRAVLGITALGDRDHVIAAYNRLMDNWARKPHLFESASGHEGADQIQADRLGVQLLAAAGYDPQAFVAFYDRVAETEGKTGSLLSRMFGTASPESRRLREILRAVRDAPPSCEPAAAPAGDAFAAWQSQVLGFRRFGRAERLAGLLTRTSLPQPLRTQLSSLRFSPDGRAVLAQDGAGITLLGRDPFQARLRIPAPAAEPAQFTPDSRHLLWHSNDLHVERWDVAAARLVDARDIVLPDACDATALAPDGAVVACVESSGDLELFDVSSGGRIVELPGFYRPSVLARLLGLPMAVPAVTMRFSPDARFFVAGSDPATFAYDLQTRTPLPLTKAARRLLTRTFAFVGPDRLAGMHPTTPAASSILRLPDGQIVDAVGLLPGDVDRPTAGEFLLIRPVQKYAVGLLNLATKTVVKAHPMPAFDVHGDVFVAERGTGDVGLYAMEGNALVAAAALPTAPLRGIQAAAVSPDFRWLAVSAPARGGIWDLTRNVRLGQVRPFAGAHLETDGSLFVDFTRTLSDPRALMRLDAAQNDGRLVADLAGQFAVQRGRWLLVTRTVPRGVPRPTGAEYELRDVRRETPLWTRAFTTDPPGASIDPGADAVVLAWPADLPASRERIRADPRLRASTRGYELEGDFLLEVLDAATGAPRGRMVLETGKGSFTIVDTVAAGDCLVVSDSLGRVVVYALATGEPQGYAFGQAPVLHAAGGRVAVENGRGRIVLYTLPAMRRVQELAFREEIVLKAFNADGTRLFVLTADQTAFVLDVDNR